MHFRKWATAVIVSFEARHGAVVRDTDRTTATAQNRKGSAAEASTGAPGTAGGGAGGAGGASSRPAGGRGGDAGGAAGEASSSAPAKSEEETINEAVHRERRRLRLEYKITETKERLEKAKKAEEEGAVHFSAALEQLRAFSTDEATAVRKNVRPGPGVFITVGSLFTLLTGGRVATEWAACRQLLSDWTGLVQSMSQFDPYTAQRGAVATVRRNLRDPSFPTAATLKQIRESHNSNAAAAAAPPGNPGPPRPASSENLAARLPVLVVHIALWIRAVEAVVAARQNIDFLVHRQEQLRDDHLTDVEEEDALLEAQQRQREAAERAKKAAAAPQQTPSQQRLQPAAPPPLADLRSSSGVNPRPEDIDAEIDANTTRLALLAAEPLARTREQRLQSRTDRAAAQLAACDEDVENALAAYEALGPASLADLRANPNPGPAVVDALTCAYILLVEPRAADWLTVKRILLMDWQGLLRELRNFDRDQPNAKAVEALRVKLAAPGFARESALKKVSPAAALLCAWARAIEQYDAARRELLELERQAAEAGTAQVTDEERERAVAMAMRRPLEEVPTHVLAEVDSGVTAATDAATGAAERAHAQMQGAIAELERHEEVLGKLGTMLVPPPGVEMLVAAVHCALRGPGALEWIEARGILVPGAEFLQRLREASDGDVPLGGLAEMRAVLRNPTFPKEEVIAAAHPATAALLQWARGLESMDRATAAMSAAAAEHGGTRAMGLVATLRLSLDSLEEILAQPQHGGGGDASATDGLRLSITDSQAGEQQQQAVEVLMRQIKVGRVALRQSAPRFSALSERNPRCVDDLGSSDEQRAASDPSTCPQLMLAALRQMLLIARERGQPDPDAKARRLAAAAASGAASDQQKQPQKQDFSVSDETNYEEAALMADIVDAGGPAVLIRILGALPSEGSEGRLHIEMVEMVSELVRGVSAKHVAFLPAFCGVRAVV